MSALKTVDELDVKSREFYERARFKLALSLVLAAVVSLRFLAKFIRDGIQELHGTDDTPVCSQPLLVLRADPFPSPPLPCKLSLVFST